MKHAITTVLAATVLFTGSLLWAVAPEQQTVDIPVTRIVLFSSGVGYFEHLGEVADDATVKLMFKTEQINDVLKSMVVMDLSESGAVTSINYASREPLARALRSFAVDLMGDPKLSDLLKQLRGARVILSAPDRITGTILGIETRTRTVNAPGGTTIIKESVLNLVTLKGLQSIPLRTVQNIQLIDPNLRSEIDKALKLIIASSDKQRKGVEVNFRGKGKREVRIGYVTETPVWKVSYRLELSGEKPYLQGWAIVENTSDQDWSGVGLSLISGRPISFIQDLYTPLYLPRPVVKPQMYASLRPREYEEGLESEKRAKGITAKDMKKLRARGGPVTRELKEDVRASRSEAKAYIGVSAGERLGGAMDLARSVQSVAAAGKVGELFQFDIKDVVDLSRRRSAMLPIIAQPIAAEKVSIYNTSVQKKHPLNGAWITNDTGLKMLGGPITVFDQKTYAGDATIGNLAENDKRLISYAIDLNMTVDPSQKSQSHLTAAKIVKGVMTLTYLHRYTQTYQIKNKSDEDRTLIIEHPRHHGRKLLEPKTYEEKTPSLYRFKVLVKKDSTQDFNVAEEQVRYQTVRIIDQNTKLLLSYAKNAKISEAARAALAKVAEMKQQLAAAERKEKDWRKQKKVIETGQDRLRKNIATVGRDSTLGKRYLKKLSGQEDQIEMLEGRIKDIRAYGAPIRKQLADFINNMNF